jgi:hypothetical protein
MKLFSVFENMFWGFLPVICVALIVFGNVEVSYLKVAVFFCSLAVWKSGFFFGKKTENKKILDALGLRKGYRITSVGYERVNK